MSDPEDGKIYSPEASDGQRFGDWQTKIVGAILVVVVSGLLMFAVGIVAKHCGVPAWWEFGTAEAPEI